MVTSVYFIAGAELIKIGRAISPMQRLSALRCQSPVPLKLLRAVPDCAGEVESALHERFAAAHSHGEWFMRTPLEEIIERWTDAEIQALGAERVRGAVAPPFDAAGARALARWLGEDEEDRRAVEYLRGLQNGRRDAVAA